MGQFEAFIGVNPWTALFVLLNTLIIYFVSRRYLFGPVMGIIRDRQQEIDTLYTQAKEARDTARQLRETYEQKLSQAAEAGEQLLREAAARAQSREEELLRQANAQAEALRARAAAQIALEKKQALNQAKDTISGLALAIAGKVVDRELEEADHARLVDRMLRELGE